MHFRKLIAIALLVVSSFAADALEPSKSELESMYDKAFTAFGEARYDDALRALDAIDRRQPDLAESLNLRGVVYMRQTKYDEAEAVLRKALSIEPGFWNASFNLAEIPFLQKNWLEARNRFEALLAGESAEMQPETSQLIQYKILLTFVLEGKENTVDWILNKFELAKESPALYYSNAAIAFQRSNEKEAREWIVAATKQFSVPLNQLYAESFYEVGWMEKPAGEARAALEITSTTERAERLKADAKANFEEAERAFQTRDFAGALKSLDLAETGAPNDAGALNLRGEILMEQKKFEEAEAAFHKAVAADPKFREARYNLAQIPLKNGDYAGSRDRFEALFAETAGGEKNQATQLIKYKIFLTLLLEGKSAEAQQLMDQFKFTGETPALYYAQAAWEFENGRTDQGNEWVASARKIYPPALNIIFADSFYDLGWLDKTSAETAPATAALAQAVALPAIEPKPEMRVGQAQTAPALSETKAASPAPASLAKSAAAATAVTAPTPVSSPVAAAKSQTRPAPTGVTGATPATRTTRAPNSGPSHQWWRPAVAEEALDRISNSRGLLVGGLLMAGILLFVWLVVQQFHRHLSTVSLVNPATPLTEPPFANDEDPGDERMISRDRLSSGPPKVSLNLIASESGNTAAPLLGAITPHEPAPAADQPAHFSSGESDQPFAEAFAVVANELPAQREESASPGEGPAVIEEPALLTNEPVAPEQLVPPLTAEFSTEPIAGDIAQPGPESERDLIEAVDAVAVAFVGRPTAQSSIETPFPTSKIITTEPTQVQPTTSDIMPETTLMPAPNIRPFAPTLSVQQPVGEMHAVQLTFSLEIASMQLTPTFKMSGLKLKPTSKVVSMRLAPSQDPQPPMNLQVTFELAKIELSGGSIGAVRLVPSAQQRPAVLTSPSFAISGLEVVSSPDAAPVQLTPSPQEKASVHLTAEFQIATIDFTPLFEIAAIVLKASSRKVSLQLPASGPSSIESAPVFEIENVQLGSGSDLALIQVKPNRSA